MALVHQIAIDLESTFVHPESAVLDLGTAALGPTKAQW